MSKSTRTTAPSSIPSGSRQGQQNNKYTLDDILGRARYALGESRQFRETPVASNEKQAAGSGLNQSALLNNFGRDDAMLRDVNAGSKIRLRRPGDIVAAPSAQRHILTNLNPAYNDGSLSDSTESKHSQISTSSAQRKHSSGSSSDSSNSNSVDSANESDDSSTITPPTVTDPPISFKIGVEVDGGQIQYPASAVDPSPEIPKVITHYNNNQKGGKKSKNLLERTLLIRGDPVSNESYAVLKAMIFEKEHGEMDNRDSYTDEWVSDVNSNTLSERRAKLSESLEIPQTETEEPEIPLDFDQSESSLTMRDTVSNLMVEEIMENLQDLEISETILNDEEPIPSIEEQIALADLDSFNKNLENDDDDGEEETNVSEKSSLTITTSSKSSFHYATSSNKRPPPTNSGSQSQSVRTNTVNSKSIPSKSIKKEKSVGASLNANNLTSRQSHRKSFQQVLSHVKLDNEAGVIFKNKKDVTYCPPKTKPQTKIQAILEKEIYNKELKRLRSVQRQADRDQLNIEYTKALNYQATREVESSGIKYKEPSYSKILLPELREDPSASTSRNLGAPYFNLDGTLGMDYTVENYPRMPRTPDENYNNQVKKMGIPQLVREVMASNERMYNMTVEASQEIAKQYGKNAKLVMKMKTRKEQERRRKKN